MTDELIFISYARKDGDSAAGTLLDMLEARGHKCWRDTRDLIRTLDFTAEIETAIDASSHVVVCVTPDTRRLDSFVRREIAYAQVCEKPITPLVLTPQTPPPISIINNTRVEQYKIGWDQAFEELEICFQQGRVIPPHDVLASDPFHDYLKTLYQTVVADLDRMVIKQIDLHNKAREDAVKQKSLEISVFARNLDVNNTEQKFDSFDAAFTRYGGRVLLLGEPGAGKTTTLKAYARDAISDRLADPEKPLPIPAVLSAWPSNDPPPLAEWLVTQHGNVPDMAQQIEDGHALLLLDGLDELGAGQTDADDPRQRFLQQIPDIPKDNHILITCRVHEYEQIGEKAELNGAVTLQPLTETQMEDYLADYQNLWTAIQHDNTLRDMCSTPLLLSIFTYGFRESSESERQILQNLVDSPGELRDRIFGMYVDRRYQHEQYRVETLPCVLDEIYAALGTAVEQRLLNRNFDIIDNTMIIEENFPAGQVEVIPPLCEKLHYLVPFENKNTGESGWRFTHLLLRNHFGYPALIAVLRHGNSDEQYQAVKALGRLGDPRAIPQLISCLDRVGQIRGLAIEALGYIPDKYGHAVPALLACLDKAQEREVAIAALRNLGEPAISMLLAQLRDSDETVRRRAAEVLPQLNWQPSTKDEELACLIAREAWSDCVAIGEPAIPALMAAMDGAALPFRINVVKTLEQTGGVQAVLALEECLHDPAVEVRGLVVEILGGIGGVRAVSALAKSLNDTDVTIRASIIDALGKIGTQQSLLALVDCLHDPAGGIREQAARILSMVTDKQIILAMAPYLDCADVSIRVMIVESLGKIVDEQAALALVGCLNDPEAVVRNLAAKTLPKTGDQQVIPLLVEDLDSAEVEQRRLIVQVLGWLGDALAVPALATCLEDSDRGVRCLAVEALDKIGDRRAIPALEAYRNDPDEAVRGRVLMALNRLGYQPQSKGDWQFVEEFFHKLSDEVIPTAKELAGDIKEYTGETIETIRASEEYQSGKEVLLEQADKAGKRLQSGLSTLRNKAMDFWQNNRTDD